MIRPFQRLLNRIGDAADGLQRRNSKTNLHPGYTPMLEGFVASAHLNRLAKPQPALTKRFRGFFNGEKPDFAHAYGATCNDLRALNSERSTLSGSVDSVFLRTLDLLLLFETDGHTRTHEPSRELFNLAVACGNKLAGAARLAKDLKTAYRRTGGFFDLLLGVVAGMDRGASDLGRSDMSGSNLDGPHDSFSRSLKQINCRTLPELLPTRRTQTTENQATENQATETQAIETQVETLVEASPWYCPETGIAIEITLADSAPAKQTAASPATTSSNTTSSNTTSSNTTGPANPSEPPRASSATDPSSASLLQLTVHDSPAGNPSKQLDGWRVRLHSEQSPVLIANGAATLFVSDLEGELSIELQDVAETGWRTCFTLEIDQRIDEYADVSSSGITGATTA